MCALDLKHAHPFIDGLKKHPEGKKKDVQKVKAWMSSQPHLPEVNDEFVYLFLHACYYSHEKTKCAIEAWFTIRANHPIIFSNRDPMEPKMKNLLDMGWQISPAKDSTKVNWKEKDETRHLTRT